MESIDKQCSHIKSEEFNVAKYLTPEIVRKIEHDYRVIPEFENKLFHIARMKHYSLTTNELLRCRLKVKFDPANIKEKKPIQFPDSSDMHFRLNTVRFLPEDKNQHQDFKRKLKPTNGVDEFGPRPIPHDMNVRSYRYTRTTGKKKSIVKVTKPQKK